MSRNEAKVNKNTEPQPVIDELAQPAGTLRFLVFGIFLVVGVALLGYFGTERLGEPIFLAILGVFASVGIFFLFSLLLGFVRLTSSKNGDAFSSTLLADMDTGLVVADYENRIVYANKAYTRLLGISGEDEVSSIESLFSRRPEASDVVYKMANAAKDGSSKSEEVRLSSGLKNGEEGARWFRLGARKVDSSVGGKPLIAWQISDITRDRVAQENAFQQLQDAIHYLDHAPAGFVASEESGALVYVNATLADWLGIDLTRFEPGSMKMQDIISADNIALFESIKKSSSTETTTVIDLDMMKSDGKLLPVRLYHRLPYSSDGAPGATRTLVINRAAVAGEGDGTSDAEVRFTRFFNSTPVAIAGVSKDGRIIRTNASFQRIFETVIADEGPVPGMQYKCMVPDDDRQQLEDLFDKALSGQGEIQPVDLPIHGQQERYVRLFVSPVADTDEASEDGAPARENEERVIIYAMETTEQRALEDQFAKGQKMQAVGQLAGGIAHDFNNVLTAIIGFSDLLLNNHKPSDPSFQDIMNIKQSANRAASLVRQLLAFSRRQTLRPQVLHLSDVLFDLRMLLDRLAGDQIELSIKHGRDIWPVKADVSQLEQVIVNLVVNARDAMSDNGKLEIRTTNVDADEIRKNHSQPEFVPGDYVMLEIEDEGTGMSPEILDKIFEPFFSTKEVGKGTGLGLSMVYGIIKQTGGYIYPETALGEGTTFRVFLPRHVVEEKADEELAAGEADKKAEPAKDLTGNATILLVEDEDAVRAFGARALISRGYEVHEAASGVEALEVMEDYGDEIDLVVSDVVMPEMDGPTLFGEIKKSHPDLKFIFVSGYAEEAFAKNLPEEDREKFGFLPKPFSLKQLAETVKEMLSA